MELGKNCVYGGGERERESESSVCVHIRRELCRIVTGSKEIHTRNFLKFNWLKTCHKKKIFTVLSYKKFDMLLSFFEWNFQENSIYFVICRVQLSCDLFIKATTHLATFLRGINSGTWCQELPQHSVGFSFKCFTHRAWVHERQCRSLSSSYNKWTIT